MGCSNPALCTKPDCHSCHTARASSSSRRNVTRARPANYTPASSVRPASSSSSPARSSSSSARRTQPAGDIPSDWTPQDVNAFSAQFGSDQSAWAPQDIAAYNQAHGLGGYPTPGTGGTGGSGPALNPNALASSILGAISSLGQAGINLGATSLQQDTARAQQQATLEAVRARAAADLQRAQANTAALQAVATQQGISPDVIAALGGALSASAGAINTTGTGTTGARGGANVTGTGTAATPAASSSTWSTGEMVAAGSAALFLGWLLLGKH